MARRIFYRRGWALSTNAQLSIIPHSRRPIRDPAAQHEQD